MVVVGHELLLLARYDLVVLLPLQGDLLLAGEPREVMGDLQIQFILLYRTY